MLLHFMNEIGKKKGGRVGRGKSGSKHTHTHTHTHTCASSIVKVESSCVVITRKQHQVHKTNFINSQVVVTNTEAENIYSKYKKKICLLILKTK